MGATEWGTDVEVWSKISPPFIPTEQDIGLILDACMSALESRSRALRILVLGVTPALIDARWPSLSEVHVVDYDRAMIDAHWQPRGQTSCHCARWQEMPFPDGHFDVVVGDCSLNALPRIDDYQEVLREIARVSRPSAPFVARFFMQPEPRLSLAGLPLDAEREFVAWSPLGRSLLVPIAASERDGSLCISDIPRRIADEWGELDGFLVALGQPPEDRALLAQIYQFEQHLNFPSRDQILKELEPWYREISFAYPAYDCGTLCPVVCCLP